MFSRNEAMERVIATYCDGVYPNQIEQFRHSGEIFRVLGSKPLPCGDFGWQFSVSPCTFSPGTAHLLGGEPYDEQTAKPEPTIGGLRHVLFNRLSGAMFAYPYDHKLAWLFFENFRRTGRPDRGAEATVRLSRFVEERYEYDDVLAVALRERTQNSPEQIEDIVNWFFDLPEGAEAIELLATQRLIDAETRADAIGFADDIRRTWPGVHVATAPDADSMRAAIEQLVSYR